MPRYRDAAAGQPRAVVGFDTRFLSDRYARAVSEVLAGERPVRQPRKGRRADAGRLLCHPDARRCGRRDDHGEPQPTALQRDQAQVGVRRQRDRGRDTNRVEAKLEEALAAGREPQRMDLDEAIEKGLVDRFDPFPAYAEHLEQLLDFETIRQGPSAGGGRCHVRHRPRLSASGCSRRRAVR